MNPHKFKILSLSETNMFLVLILKYVLLTKVHAVALHYLQSRQMSKQLEQSSLLRTINSESTVHL